MTFRGCCQTDVLCKGHRVLPTWYCLRGNPPTRQEALAFPGGGEKHVQGGGVDGPGNRGEAGHALGVNRVRGTRTQLSH